MNETHGREETFARIEELERRLAHQLRQTEKKAERIVADARTQSARIVQEGKKSLADASSSIADGGMAEAAHEPPLASRKDLATAERLPDHALEPLAQQLFTLLIEQSGGAAP